MKPTVGRIVAYYPAPHDYTELASAPGEARAAIVAHAFSFGLVNLMVIDGNGNPRSRTSVPFHQLDDTPPMPPDNVAGFATWPERETA